MFLVTSNIWDTVDAQIFVGRQERKRYRENKDRKAKLHFFAPKLSIYFNEHCFNLNSAQTLEYRANSVAVSLTQDLPIRKRVAQEREVGHHRKDKPYGWGD